MKATVIGNLSRKLPAANMTLNQIPTSILGPKCDTQACRPYPQFSDVQLLLPNLGVSNYYAGMWRIAKRYSRGLSAGASYTWSKYLTNADTGSTVGNNSGPYSNFYNRRADYGPSANDVEQRFTGNWVYELPFGEGKPWLAKNPLRYVVGGWTLTNVMTFQSGAPFTVTSQTDTTNSFAAGALRPNVLQNPNLPSSKRSVSDWFNTSAFAQPAQFQFGDEGVGTLRGAGIVNLDFSLLREFRLKERLHLQLRGDFFNALNHTNLGLPGLSFGSATFGVISTAGAARQVEVGARLAF